MRWLALALLLLSTVTSDRIDVAPHQLPRPRLVRTAILRPHYFKSRVSYYPNADSSFNVARIALSGDVELNPGPDTAAGGGAGDGIGCAGQRARRGKITLLGQNVQSIRGKLGPLRATAPALAGYSILALTETWLDPSVDTGELEHALPDHTWYRRDRGTRGGGIVCAVNSKLRPYRRGDLEKDTCELLAVELKSFPRIILMVCYCPPSVSGAVAEVMALIQNAMHSNPSYSFLISGDFNIPSISWHKSDSSATPVLTRTCRRAADFLEACQLSLLTQHVHQPTRGANVLDLVLSSADLRVVTTVQDGLICSDHREVFVKSLQRFPQSPW